jgi:hypothetical protein
MHSKIQADTDLLLRQVAGLAKVRKYHETWEEFGERVEFRNDRNRPRILRAEADREVEKTEAAPRASNWQRAKELMYALFAGVDSEHDTMRKRFQSRSLLSAPSHLHLLSLWLAGILKISIQVTRQMVAAILYAVAEMGGDWRIIRHSLDQGTQAGELSSFAHA